jgi:hypothetical protein
MVPLTRRRALAGAATLLAGLAGCGGSEETAVDVNPREEPENVATDPERYALRNPTEERAVTVSDDGEELDGRKRDAARRGVVADADTAAVLSFADIKGANDARAFVSATDFSAATLYLDRMPVDECYRMELCYVTWTETEIQTRYGRQYRDWDVACDAEETDTAVYLIRIPAALDPRSVSSLGGGYHSGSCRRPPWERRFDHETAGDETTANATTANATANGGAGGEQ